MQPHAQRAGTDGDRTDHGNAVVAVRTVYDGRFPARRQRAAHQRGEQKTRFIQQGNVRPPLHRLPKHARPLLGDPTFHLFVVTLAGVFLGFLTGPVQTLFQQLAYMFRVILDPEVSLDQDRHTPRGPQGVGPTVRDRSLPEQGAQVSHLRVGQAARTPQGRFGAQTTPMACHASPTMYRRWGYPQNTGYDRWRFASPDQLHGTHPPSLQIFCASWRSHTSILRTPKPYSNFTFAGLRK